MMSGGYAQAACSRFEGISRRFWRGETLGGQPHVPGGPDSERHGCRKVSRTASCTVNQPWCEDAPPLKVPGASLPAPPIPRARLKCGAGQMGASTYCPAKAVGRVSLEVGGRSRSFRWRAPGSACWQFDCRPTCCRRRQRYPNCPSDRDRRAPATPSKRAAARGCSSNWARSRGCEAESPAAIDRPRAAETMAIRS
jgi:hypothetical protein